MHEYLSFLIRYGQTEGVLKKKVVVTQEAYDELLKLVGKSEAFDPSKTTAKLPQIQVTSDLPET